MKLNKKFYLPIKSVNLPHYFQIGCVVPTQYVNERNKDIQDRYNNHLVFCDIPYTDETDCALEIVLNSEVEEVFEISKNFFLFDKPTYI